MKRDRDTGLKLALVAGLGAGTFAALKYSGAFEASAAAGRDIIVAQVAAEIKYKSLIERGILDTFRRQIPGPWKVSSVFADLLTERGNDRWAEEYGPIEDQYGNTPVYMVDASPADTKRLGGLYVYREHLGGEIVEIGRNINSGETTNWLVGLDSLPKCLREKSYLLRHSISTAP